MTIGERIKILRKEHLGLTQADFGAKIGVGGSAIGLCESGDRAVTDRNISAICSEFHVNEKWLRDGTGQMLKESDGSILSRIKEEYGADALDLQIVDKYLKLSSEKRKTIKEYLLSIVSSYLQASAAGQAETPSAARTDVKPDPDIEAELASYRRELEEEKEARTSSASENTKGNTAG